MATVWQSPDEILLRIFCLLPLIVRIQVLPLVCSKWRQLSRDPALFRQLDLAPVKLAKKRRFRGQFEQFLEQVRPVHLHLRGHHEACQQVDWEVVGAAMSQRLLELRLHDCSLHGDSLLLLLRKLEMLRYVSLQRIPEVDDAVVSLLAASKRLLTLDIDLVLLRSSRSLRLLADAEMPQLEQLNLGVGGHFAGSHLTGLLRAHDEKLRRLGMDLDELEAQLELEGCCNLRIVQCRSPSAELFAQLCRLPALRELYVTNVPQFSFQERSFSQLHHLRLIWPCSLQDDNVATICEQNPGLQTFSISWAAAITSRSLRLIAENCPKLQALQLLSCTGVNPADFLLEHLHRRLPHLLVVDVRLCRRLHDASTATATAAAAFTLLASSEKKPNNRVFGVPLQLTRQRLQTSISSPVALTYINEYLTWVGYCCMFNCAET